MTTALAEVEQRPTLLYFFEEYCDSCHPEIDFSETFHTLTGRHVSEYAYSYYNVRFADNRLLFEKTADEYGIAQEDRLLPMAIVNGKVYPGDSKITLAMPLDFIENTSTDSLIYYLYSPACESCADAEKFLDALSGSIEVTRGEARFDSSIVVNRINIYDDPSTAAALFQRYQVPDDKQTTPIVFLRERYLNGAERIERYLEFYLKTGEAVGTTILTEKANDLSAFTVAGTALAGFVAGFNPCALSMLLLFVSLLLSAGRRIALYAGIYLGAKFVVYLVIGFLLLSLFSTWAPKWLPLAAKLLMTAASAALIVLNIMDARNAYFQKYGKIKNQLPKGLRRFLNDHIRVAAGSHSKTLPVIAGLLGILVAAGEFLCSGQLYLATLIGSISARIDVTYHAFLLVVFCTAFVLPSAGITFAVTRTHDMFSTSNALRQHMPLIKLATAAAMLFITLAAWLI